MAVHSWSDRGRGHQRRIEKSAEGNLAIESHRVHLVGIQLESNQSPGNPARHPRIESMDIEASMGPSAKVDCESLFMD